MFFIKSGKISAVLPKYNNFEFLKIKSGYYFGELDLIFYNEMRKYSLMAAKDSELLVLGKKHFKNAFLIEFRNIGMNFVKNAYFRKIRFRKTYQEAIKFCKKNKEEFKDNFVEIDQNQKIEENVENEKIFKRTITNKKVKLKK